MYKILFANPAIICVYYRLRCPHWYEKRAVLFDTDIKKLNPQMIRYFGLAVFKCDKNIFLAQLHSEAMIFFISYSITDNW